MPLALKYSPLQNKKMLCSFMIQVICLRFAMKTRIPNTESALNGFVVLKASGRDFQSHEGVRNQTPFGIQ